jgi:predicted porin
MKKSLVVLAALAATSAFAQSSVTIYGRVDGMFQKAPGVGLALGNANGTSRIGFRGVEDLGGGMKAMFEFQHRFQTESGGLDGSTAARPFWQGKSTVALGGGFGTVELGRQLTAAQGPSGGLIDPWGVDTAGSIWNAPGAYQTDPINFLGGNGLGRSNVINYTTPNFGGVQAAVSIGLKDEHAPLTSVGNTKNLTSLWVGYGNGPIAAGVGFEQNRVGDKWTVLGGSYNFGVAKVNVGYGNVDIAATAGSHYTAFSIGGSIPLGATKILVGYNTSKAEGTGVKTNKLGLGAHYALSKRTTLMVNMGKPKGVSAGYDFGVSHAF